VDPSFQDAIHRLVTRPTAKRGIALAAITEQTFEHVIERVTASLATNTPQELTAARVSRSQR
jgi:hypothetical protein